MNQDIYFRWKMYFCFGVIIGLFMLTLCIALGNVRMDSSAGLPALLECWKTLAAGCSTWLFMHRSGDNDLTSATSTTVSSDGALVTKATSGPQPPATPAAPAAQ